MSGIMCAVMGGGAFAQLTSKTHNAFASAPSVPTSAITIGSDGQYSRQINGVSADTSGEWWSAAPITGIGNLYEVRFTEITGTVSTGTTGVFLALSSDRIWSVTRTTLGSKSCTGTLEIRPTGGAVVASATITLLADQS
jgi:hypothetical protein